MQLSDASALTAIVSFCLTVLAGIASILWRLSRLDFKVETMWQHLTTPAPDKPRRGRRRSDPPLLYTANDTPAPLDARGGDKKAG